MFRSKIIPIEKIGELIAQTYKIIELHEQSVGEFVTFDNQPSIQIAASKILQATIDFLTMIESEHEARYGRSLPPRSQIETRRVHDSLHSHQLDCLQFQKSFT